MQNTSWIREIINRHNPTSAKSLFEKQVSFYSLTQFRVLWTKQMKQKNINWCVCSEDWTPWVSCDQAVWPGDKTKISPIPGSFSRNFHTFLLSYFMYFFYNCVLFDVDWISGDWRPHEAEAPVYVLLWTGGTLWFYWFNFLSTCFQYRHVLIFLFVCIWMVTTEGATLW